MHHEASHNQDWAEYGSCDASTSARTDLAADITDDRNA
jgi:hypothetical protein